eukprot:GHVU01192058.1.p2 GENE.GHVU01192058.1~~GHVU01192058.1.p2  ORF type:complete len:100 (+),score=8.13 GHVU01192058.1:187-486(+)
MDAPIPAARLAVILARSKRIKPSHGDEDEEDECHKETNAAAVVQDAAHKQMHYAPTLRPKSFFSASRRIFRRLLLKCFRSARGRKKRRCDAGDAQSWRL